MGLQCLLVVRSVQRPFDSARLRQPCRGVGRSPQAGSWLTETRQPCRAGGPRAPSIPWDTRWAPLPILAIQCVAGDAGETWDPWRTRHPRVPTAGVSPLTLLPTLPFGSDVADLPGGTQEAGNAPRSHGSVEALLPRWPWRPWRSGGAHGTDPPQGGSLGADSHLRQLLLHHLQHHVNDVLVPGIPSCNAALPRHPRHTTLPQQPPWARRTWVAPHTR